MGPSLPLLFRRLVSAPTASTPTAKIFLYRLANLQTPSLQAALPRLHIPAVRGSLRPSHVGPLAERFLPCRTKLLGLASGRSEEEGAKSIQCVPCSLSPWVERAAGLSSLYRARYESVDLYLHTPVRLEGMVLN